VSKILGAATLTTGPSPPIGNSTIQLSLASDRRSNNLPSFGGCSGAAEAAHLGCVLLYRRRHPQGLIKRMLMTGRCYLALVPADFLAPPLRPC
jgi:hypothetical protein